MVEILNGEKSSLKNAVIASQDKQLMEFPTGHVGLCIGSKAHEKLWPNVVKWLAERS
jgi:polyhydroxyalkanoate synthase